MNIFKNFKENHLAIDKWYHRMACTFIGFVIAGITTTLGVGVITSAILAVGVTTIVGIIKESFDKKRGEEFDLYDLLADVEGAIVGTALGCVVGLN